MATTTTNFGWPVPQSTDLVKDGATAISNLGSGVDTSMAQLKGGTTGQILSKTSGTDMAFTWVDANPGDITGVTAGTGLTGGGTSGSVTLNIDPTYYLLANQTRRNPVLNSNFSVWQRGTSLGNASGVNTYLADRWCAFRGASGSTVSRQATGDTTNLPNIQYAARVQRDSGNTATNIIYYSQSFESVNSILYAGKTVTLSFYARAGANFSAASNLLKAQVLTGTGTDQNIISGYTGSATPIDGSATLTTTWQRFQFTATLSSSLTELGLWFYFTPVGTAGANDYYEITGVQLELGSVANTYQPNGATYQAELAACQRYYWRNTSATGTYAMVSTGYVETTTGANFNLLMPVEMRVAPTSMDFSSLRVYDSSALNAVSNITMGNMTSKVANFTAVTTGLTVGRACALLAGTSGTPYVGINAEL